LAEGGVPCATSDVVQPATDPAAAVDVGDVLQVSVFEMRGGSSPGNFVTLPSLTVDCAGSIVVPHAGQISVAGRTLADIERDIEERLARRAIGPRVSVLRLETGRPASGRCAGHGSAAEAGARLRRPAGSA
jgi:protein involved in polysaccharide export with SLBB domain